MSTSTQPQSAKESLQAQKQSRDIMRTGSFHESSTSKSESRKPINYSTFEKGKGNDNESHSRLSAENGIYSSYFFFHRLVLSNLL